MVWSHTSVESDWVRAEAAAGRERGILIPVRLDDDSILPLEFRRIQTADLSEWDGSDVSPEFEGLCDDVKHVLERSPKAPGLPGDHDVSREVPPPSPRARPRWSADRSWRDRGRRWAPAILTSLVAIAIAIVGSRWLSQTRTPAVGHSPSSTGVPRAVEPEDREPEQEDELGPDGAMNPHVARLKNGSLVRLVGSIVKNDSNVADTIVRRAIESDAWRYNRCYDGSFGHLKAEMPEGSVIIGFDILDQLPQHVKLDRSDFSEEGFNDCMVSTLLGQAVNTAGPNGKGHVTYALKFLLN